MDHKLALTTALTLAHRESTMGEAGGVSTELIRNLLELVKVSDVKFGSGESGSSVANVKNTLSDICRQAEIAVYSSDDLITRLRLNIIDDDQWLSTIEKSINSKLDEVGISKSIIVLRRKLAAFINQEKVARILRERTSEWNFRHDTIEDPTKFIQGICTDLEGIMSHSGVKDNSVQSEIDFDKIETVEAVTKKTVDMLDGSTIWKTGWQDLNDMFQGGFREGEMVVIGALAHKDKTGTSLSIFKQLAMYNEPRVRKPGKKPTLLRLTLEDPLSKNMLYLYRNIMFNDTNEDYERPAASKEEMASVVTNCLKSRGFSVQMAYVDPSDWSYRSLQNYILKKEAEGADIQVLMIDYLSMIPRTGCTQGPMGTDLQDLFRRIRNFCASRGILLITPHQLSTEAQNLTRNLVTDEGLLEYIANKGYWQDAKGLAREFDAGFYVHHSKRNGRTYRHYHRDKHRWPGILETSKLSFIHEYPMHNAIPDDLGKERIGFRKIGKPVSNAAEGAFF